MAICLRKRLFFLLMIPSLDQRLLAPFPDCSLLRLDHHYDWHPWPAFSYDILYSVANILKQGVLCVKLILYPIRNNVI